MNDTNALVFEVSNAVRRDLLGLHHNGIHVLPYNEIGNIHIKQ